MKRTNLWVRFGGFCSCIDPPDHTGNEGWAWLAVLFSIGPAFDGTEEIGQVPAMKKYLPIAAGIVLGALFVMSAVVVLFNLVKMPPPPEGSSAALFFGAIGPTGYLTFVKMFELSGGILVMIPRLRNLGLLVLGPIIVNILAFHVFIGAGHSLIDPMLLTVVALALYLLWAGRKNFSGLLN